ncbi:MAG: PEP-CTERM sorting domain-containing protein [Akkermansia sp.]|nr:PEP-CTERM sorting domain-containing protein [Akkermansia sp.]
MKKTLITLMALAGVAVANTATLTLPGNDDFTWIAGSNANGIGTGASADIVQQLATAITSTNIGNTDLVGWFGGTGQAYGSGHYGSDISIISSTSFSFKSRPELSGEYVALGVALENAADAITLSFTTNNQLGYSLWSYDGTTVTELIGNTFVGGAGDVSVTYDAAFVEPTQLFVVWTANHPSGNAGDGQTVEVSNIGISYIPEPATATLSLLALAGLAARRRRK